MTERPKGKSYKCNKFARRNFGKHGTCSWSHESHESHESALRPYKSPFEIERETVISRSSVRRIAKHDLRLKPTSVCQGYCHSLDGATLFSKNVLKKLRINAKNELTLICAKFGTDLINISTVTRCKTKCLSLVFLAYSVHIGHWYIGHWYRPSSHN